MGKKLSLEEIVKFAKLTDAKGFDEFIKENDLDVEYDEINLTNPNEGWYQVRLFDYNNAEITFVDGGFDLAVNNY